MSQNPWLAARTQMLLDPQVINLNTGSFGPLPKPVFDRVTQLRRRQAEEPMDFLLRGSAPLLWTARERLAQFLGCVPNRLVFTANVTAAINMVAASLQLNAPGEILLTDHEYGAMHWCWERAAQRLGLGLRTVALPAMPQFPGEIVETVRKALRDNTRLLFFSHILSPTGMVLPAREICAEAKKRGVLTVVDGAHAPAMIPIELASLGCDFYGGNCHKWLLAPTGSGFLYLEKGNEDRLQPLQVSWGWHHAPARLDERGEFGATPRIRALEFEGTRDICPWLAVPAAIDFQAELGWDSIRQRNADLARFVCERFGKIPGLRSATPSNPALHGFMTAFWLPAGTEPT
ncbi:MAG TPA: aminotransferase class V-fold PLP-dependent enzyme, partial [Gemmataceae bacterium]|nr:aminotransferase class V-fold PLP-dependent enzyme [Gemmataceae bacterium]